MPIPVKLQAVVDEMDVLSDQMTAYINRKTCELFTVTEEDIMALESDGDGLDVPDWQAEILPKVKEVLESGDFIELPDKYEIHEYAVMERFCLGVDDDRLCDALCAAIRERGAFRRFKDLVHREGIADDWYAFRNAALAEIAADFLNAEGIAYRAPEPIS